VEKREARLSPWVAGDSWWKARFALFHLQFACGGGSLSVARRRSCVIQSSRGHSARKFLCKNNASKHFAKLNYSFNANDIENVVNYIDVIPCFVLHSCQGDNFDKEGGGETHFCSLLNADEKNPRSKPWIFLPCSPAATAQNAVTASLH
jgi:hypothetical protein